MSEKLRKVITDAQDILARYIVPDSGITEHECVNQLLGLLDGPQAREALAVVSANSLTEGDLATQRAISDKIAPITGEITGNRANTLKAKAILGVVEHYLRCGDYPHLDKGEFTVVAQALRAYAATISKQEAVGMVNPATGYGSATGANACMPSTPDFHDFAARHPEWCSGTMLVKMRAAFDAGRSSVSSTAAPYVSPLLALTPKMPSAHDHGNCELCDWQEHRIAELESILSSTAAKGPAQLVEVLDDIEDYLEQHQDVMDGNDGTRPNEAMSLLSRIAEARTQWARAALSATGDKERLDWLEKREEGFANIDRITSANGKFNAKSSLREAIDAAMDRTGA